MKQMNTHDLPEGLVKTLRRLQDEYPTEMLRNAISQALGVRIKWPPNPQKDHLLRIIKRARDAVPTVLEDGEFTQEDSTRLSNVLFGADYDVVVTALYSAVGIGPDDKSELGGLMLAAFGYASEHRLCPRGDRSISAEERWQ